MATVILEAFVVSDNDKDGGEVRIEVLKDGGLFFVTSGDDGVAVRVDAAEARELLKKLTTAQRRAERASS